jgi:hypothetical protein
MRILIVAGLVLWGGLCFGQKQEPVAPPPLDPAKAKSEAKELVAQMLAQRPAESGTNDAVLKISPGKNKWHEAPLKISIFAEGNAVSTLYETANTNATTTRLLIKHVRGAPTVYELWEGQGDAGRKLSGTESMMPFAGSDFWLADLGLEFLHWPNQRLLKKELRRHQACGVLESTNPQTNGYSRIVCWVDLDAPHGIVHADGYGPDGQLLKVFDPTSIKKVHGEYELAEMEIRNRKTGSRTRIDFKVE